MSRYHVNPETGNAGPCKATVKCPFGDFEADHYDTPAEARKAFELSQEEGTVKTKVKVKSLDPTVLASDLRDSVRDYRDPATLESEREHIRAYWKANGVRNQFSAMLKASEVERNSKVKQKNDEPKVYPSYSREESIAIARTIKSQVGVHTLMSLGASDFMATNGGLRFNARILPFNANGERSERPSKMIVEVKLNGSDYYDVSVHRIRSLKAETHYAEQDVDAQALSSLLYSLDYDGPEACNPRL